MSGRPVGQDVEGDDLHAYVGGQLDPARRAEVEAQGLGEKSASSDDEFLAAMLEFELLEAEQGIESKSDEL